MKTTKLERVQNPYLLTGRGERKVKRLTNLASPAFAETKLNSVAVTVGDQGNPYFIQIVHGAEAQAKKFNAAVKFTAESSNYDVNTQSNQVDNLRG